MLCMYVQITLMSMNCRLLGFLYAFIISSYHVFASPSYARLPGALTLKLTSLQRYHVANHLQDDLPLCGSPPSTTTLPPPTPASGSPTVGSYIPSPSVPSSSSYPTPPASPSSSYPSYPTPPSCYATPYTPPISTNPGSPASYQPGNGLSPPYSYEPSPPYSYEPSPPTFSFPSPTGFIPAPPLFEPPVVYPPPNGPPPPHSESESALWCVAKPSVPDPIIQEAMSYACGSGADCESLQPNGDCFLPDTLFAHASYAFNSYWQRTKVAGATCSFGGSAMLVTVDPSYDGCHFIYF
ncbi:putative X8 domain-containing protein [Helianthus annuus]|uniref:X8 domain-containing protein n=1 Tax=Helianthus annuus TaxID=4232 RepID=A0A9K3MZI4_HELAN|nr:leucine-rich repeat extensin-like protein 5 isoform X1 [Helianthus annuus]KAF5781476.1 putative X8 domain-containing protein [Helianthus annuus]KAJ0501067.1 putative carbohydrate-binding X8 domain-containing protein, plant [Helianthus annuus]KAJ0508768.1 putative X8 domain-containing protein [Helianthus annuus]KAJ0516960.1 putative carbohydrate-binding X8 domain-containing protein, plant [Helianthus annuus]KAJ0684969.1 putative carbohydrate-binding X8 domain-containing protein, plant [Helia